MRISTATIMTAALGPAGVHCIVSGFLKTCSNVTMAYLKGDPGRPIMLQARCEPYGDDPAAGWTVLDLNTCFGWSRDTCELLPPPAGRFTDSCTNCSWAAVADGVEDPHGKLECWGPCDLDRKVEDVLRVIDLGKFS